MDILHQRSNAYVVVRHVAPNHRGGLRYPQVIQRRVPLYWDVVMLTGKSSCKSVAAVQLLLLLLLLLLSCRPCRCVLLPPAIAPCRGCCGKHD
jgi:hypothetical protein